MQETSEAKENVFVARESDVRTLRQHLEAALAGDGRTLVLQAPVGGGKRALVGELVREAASLEDDVLVLRIPVMDEEDGMRTLVRMYAGLYGALHREKLLGTKVEMVLNAQLPRHSRRTQAWFQAFIEGLKRPPKPGEDTFQLSLPRDNPALGLIKVLLGIASKLPVILELQNIHNCHSLPVLSLLEALMDALAGKTRMLLLLGSEPIDDHSSIYISAAWRDLLARRREELEYLQLEPWGATEVQEFLESRGLDGNASGIARVASGKPGFVAELVDLLKERDMLGDDLDGMGLIDLTPTDVDESELDDAPEDSPEEPDTQQVGKRRKAQASDAPLVAHLAALLGQLFPSSLVADIAGLERDSVDDLLDACGGLFKEVQYSEQIKSWMYAFKRGIYRFGILEANRDEQARQRAGNVGRFIERFLVPRGHAFIVKAIRVHAEAGESERAALLKGMAISADRTELWAMAHEILKEFPDVSWPDPMRRAVLMNLLERLILANAVEPAEKVFNEAIAWASQVDDRTMQGWVLLLGSRLDQRRGDLFRARDRANDSLTFFNSEGDKMRAAEVHSQIAMIELSDGNSNAALEQVELAETSSDSPNVKAQAAFIRGLVYKRDRKFSEAIQQFKTANERAGQIGQGALALEAALNLGETLLFTKQADKAADVLNRCVQIAQALRNPVKERTASALLGQAQATLKHFQAAINSAGHALELTGKLNFKQLLAADTYNLGLFNFLAGNHHEAASLFRQAMEHLAPADRLLRKEIHFNLGMALKSVGEISGSREAFQAALEPALQSKDWNKVLVANRELGDMARDAGNSEEARKYYEAAMEATESGGIHDARKALRRRLDSLK